MKLSQLLERLNYECVQGSVDIPVSHLLYDSRSACPDGVFVCISGAVMDGHKFIPDVVSKGVCAVIVEKDVTAPSHVTVIRVNNTREALAFMSAFTSRSFIKTFPLAIVVTTSRPVMPKRICPLILFSSKCVGDT